MNAPEEMSQREHIRYRASMYLGRLGDGTNPDDGMYLMLQDVLHPMVNEHREGHGNRLEVRMEDKQTINIRDYGRGLSFEERYADSNHFPRMIEELTGFGIDTVNALSSCMDICIYRKGIAKELHYEEGSLLGEWTEKTKHKDGISITFSPDESIFGTFQFKEDIVLGMLRELSYLNVGLEMVYGNVSMKSLGGMVDLLADKMEYEGEYLYPIVHFKDEVLEIALTHLQAEEDRCFSFVNGLYTKRGGSHLQAFKRTVADVLLELYPSEGFASADVFAGMVGAVSIYVEEPSISRINKWSLWSMYMKEDKKCTMDEYMKEFFGLKFKAYLQEHPEVREVIYERMSESKNKHRLC